MYPRDVYKSIANQMEASLFSNMKTIIVICIVLSMFEGYHGVPTENLEMRNRRDIERPNPPHPPFPSGSATVQGQTKDIPKHTVAAVPIPARLNRRDTSIPPIPIIESFEKVSTQSEKQAPTGLLIEDLSKQNTQQSGLVKETPESKPGLRVSTDSEKPPPTGVLIEDLPKQNTQQGGLVKETTESRPGLRNRRQTRPSYPGSAGRPQIQPVRPGNGAPQPHIMLFGNPLARRNRREAQQTLPGSGGQPPVQPTRDRKQTGSSSSAKPQVQPTRPSREAQNRPELLPFAKPDGHQRNRRDAQQSGTADQPQVQPPRTKREAQNRPYATTFQRPNGPPGRLTKDIPKTRPIMQKYRREASDTSAELNGSPKPFEVNEASLKLYVNEAPL